MMNHLGGNADQQVTAESPLTKHPKELTQVEKKMLKNEKLSAVWLEISKHALNQDYQSAYDKALV